MDVNRHVVTLKKSAYAVPSGATDAELFARASYSLLQPDAQRNIASLLLALQSTQDHPVVSVALGQLGMDRLQVLSLAISGAEESVRLNRFKMLLWQMEFAIVLEE